jgi:predicted enzyme related to lactoylglutathione lyase
MSEVQVGQKTYQMPPQDGITIAHFMVVADIERSLRFYETVFGSRILSRGDSKGVPANPDLVSSFMNIHGKAEEPSSSPSQSPNTARRAATSAIPMAT